MIPRASARTRGATITAALAAALGALTGGVSCGTGVALAPVARQGAVQVGDARYVYDVNGLATAISGTATARPRDALGRITQIGDVTLHYGADGQLASAGEGEQAVRYVHDENGQRLARFDENGQGEAFFEGGVRLTATRLSQPVRVGGRVVGVLEAALDATVSQAASFRAIPVDRRGTRQDGPGGAFSPAAPHGARRGEAAEDPMLAFAAATRDPLTGLVRLGARDYDPESYRFVTPDPLFLERPELCRSRPAECNLYGYAANTPLDVVDPSGLAGERDADAGDARAMHVSRFVGRYKMRELGWVPELSLPIDDGEMGASLEVRAYVYQIVPDSPYYLAGSEQSSNLSLELTHIGPSVAGELGLSSKKGVFIGGEISALKLEGTLQGCHYLCVSATGSVGLSLGAHLGFKDGQLKAGVQAGFVGFELGLSPQTERIHEALRSRPEPLPALPAGMQKPAFDIVGVDIQENGQRGSP